MPHIQNLVLQKLAVQVGTFDIYLVQLQPESIGHGDDGAQRRKPGNWSVSVKIVDTFDLTKTLRHEVCLVPHNLSGGILLSFENPFRADNIGSRWCVFKGPGAGSVEGGKLVSNCLCPRRRVGLACCL